MFMELDEICHLLRVENWVPSKIKLPCRQPGRKTLDTHGVKLDGSGTLRNISHVNRSNHTLGNRHFFSAICRDALVPVQGGGFGTSGPGGHLQEENLPFTHAAGES
jgi:hypothetical protein